VGVWAEVKVSYYFIYILYIIVFIIFNGPYKSCGSPLCGRWGCLPDPYRRNAGPPPSGLQGLIFGLFPRPNRPRSGLLQGLIFGLFPRPNRPRSGLLQGPIIGLFPTHIAGSPDRRGAMFLFKYIHSFDLVGARSAGDWVWEFAEIRSCRSPLGGGPAFRR
jgi:hypothetical protein